MEDTLEISFSQHEKIIGLTGGMGSGKSGVAMFFRDAFGAAYIDSDHICRQLLAPRAKGWCAVENIFGRRFFNSDETLDRQLLRNVLFQDKDVRLQVNQILHPLVRQEIAQLVQKMRRGADDLPRIIVEVPLLFEARWQADFGRIIVVYADQQQCVDRLMKRDGLLKQEAEVSMAAQWPLMDKVLLADHVIDNSGTWAETCLQVLHLGRVLW